MKFIKEVHNAEAIPSPARGKATIFCIIAIIKNRIIMKLIYRTLLLNKVCAQGSGAARRCAVRLTKRKSLQRYEVYQRSTQCPSYPVSRSIKAQPIVVRKTFLYFDVLKLARVISFKIVSREKRRFLGRTGRFYAFTFGISQKSAVLIY